MGKVHSVFDRHLLFFFYEALVIYLFFLHFYVICIFLFLFTLISFVAFLWW